MSNLPKNGKGSDASAMQTLSLLETNPEVKSYIYQQIAEFEPFVTPETSVSVVARDARKLALHFESEGRPMSTEQLKKLHRIAIILQEGDTTIQEEGWHENIFHAIQIAKEKLLSQLIQIHDKVVSASDRQQQINQAIQGHLLH